jgi:hypothetical protein
VIGLTPIVHVAKLDCEGCEAIRHRNDGAAPESRHREEHVFYRSATMIERTELGLLNEGKIKQGGKGRRTHTGTTQKRKE